MVCYLLCKLTCSSYVLIYEFAFTYVSTEERMPSYEWTQVAYWKHPHLSYAVFIALSILGGVIGLDHLYLRSPATAVLKLASFFMLPFFWYLYDIIQATAEKKLFMKYGLVTPFITTAGIGAGMFKDPMEPDKEALPEDQTPPNSLWFMGFFLMSLLPFGLDHFIVGDNNGGLAKLLIMLIPIIGFIYAVVWTFYSLFRIFFKTETIFSHGISRFVTPKMDEYFFAAGRLGMPAAKPIEPKKMTFMDLLKSIWSNIKKFFTGGDEEKEKDVETHGLIDAAIRQGTEFVKEKIIAKSPLAQKVVASVELAKNTLEPTVGAAVTSAGAVKELIETAPAQAQAVAGILESGLNEKIGKLPSPMELAEKKARSLVPDVPSLPSPMNMVEKKAAGLVSSAGATVEAAEKKASGLVASAVAPIEAAEKKASGLVASIPSLNEDPRNLNIKQAGGGIVSDNSTAILALIAMFAIVASFSLGKYMFIKLHGPQEEKAAVEKPPTRSEFVIKRDKFSDSPPLPNKEKNIVPAMSVSQMASA